MLEGFFAAVKEARIKFEVPDVLVVAQSIHRDAEDEEYTSIVQMHFGDWSKSEALAAYAYGRAQVDRENYIKQMLAARKR